MFGSGRAWQGIDTPTNPFEQPPGFQPVQGGSGNAMCGQIPASEQAGLPDEIEHLFGSGLGHGCYQSSEAANAQCR